MQTSPWAMANTVLYLGLLFVGLLLAHYALRRLRFHTTIPFPPGPPSRPVIGQLLSMPQQSEHLVFTEIGKQVGSDIISLSFFGTTVIVLNSAEAATEILDKRANIYSNREVPPMLASPLLMNLQDFFVFMNPTERWRRYRRLIHSRLNKQSIAAFHAPQEHQAKLLLQRLLDSSPYLTNSDKLDDEFNRTIASTAFDLVYGYPLETAQDPFLTDTKILMDNIMKAAMPSNFLVNAFPWLAYVPTWAPGAQWKKTAFEWRDQKDKLTDSIYNWTKERANAGTDECSLIASALKDCQQAGYDWTTTDEFSKRLGIAMYGGATDTLVSALLSFILAMVLFPETQTKAQQEIDAVVGCDRLPTAEDRPHLHYIERMVHEIIRWQPPAPLAVPHVSDQDDEYRGYRIPKGAIVFGNVWAMTRDENTYKNPDKFDPDRFLDPALPTAPAFGWGRRVCPGNHFTHTAVFVFVSSMLATFDVKRCKDDTGCDIIPTAEGASNSLVYHPKPFQFRLKVRSNAHSELIRNTV